jgi:hypothetical protein
MGSSRLGNAIAIIGAGMGGYARGMQDYQRQQADEEDRQWLRRQRMRMADEQDRADQLRKDVAEALATPDVRQVAAPGELTVGANGPELATAPEFRVAGQNYPTAQDAQAARGPASSKSARMERVAAAFDKAGQPDVAERYRSLAKQARDEGALELIDAIRGAAPSIDDVRATKAGFVSHEIPADAIKSYDGTGKWRITPGTMVQSYVSKDVYGNDVLDHRLVRPDGTVMLDSLNAAGRFIGMDPGQRAAAADRDAATRYMVGRDARDYAATQADRDRNFRLRETEVADKSALRAAQAEAIAARAAAAQASAARAAAADNPTAPVPIWDDKADAFLRSRYTVTDPMTGQTMVDGQGLQFAKKLALAQARRNGGDTTSALGYAFEVDGKIHREAGGDPDKIAAKRVELMRAMMAPPPAPDTALTARPSTPAERAAAPAAAVQEAAPTPEQRAEAIRQRLAVDDRIKKPGMSGLLGRAVQEGAFPLSIVERMDLERELARLTGAPAH